jgi:diketogulonate reductase-like aldo/keto reductase
VALDLIAVHRFRLAGHAHNLAQLVQRDLGSSEEERNSLLQLGGPGTNLLRDPFLARIAAAHGCSAATVALAWTIRSGHIIAIPESGSVAHVKENAIALSLALTPQELQALDAAHPPPSR